MKIDLKGARSRLTSHRDADTDVSPSRPTRTETRRQSRETAARLKAETRETSHRLKAEARETAARLRDEMRQARQAERETAARLKASRLAKRDAGASHVPGWVDWLPRGGWPMVAVIVMVMCAPGEHHLARLAGWDVRLAWGMPACLVAYAGIAASVATRRRRGSQGRRTAVIGAVVSLLAAMSAQPVSHLFVTGHWSADPSPVWLVVAVSCVPPLVLGHLMHMAASHGQGPAFRRNVPGKITGTLSRLGVHRSSRPVESPGVLSPPVGAPDVPSLQVESPDGATQRGGELPLSVVSLTHDDSVRPTTRDWETSPLRDSQGETRELLTRDEAAALASQIRGETVTPKTISNWKYREIIPKSDDVLYRRDDVIKAARR